MIIGYSLYLLCCVYAFYYTLEILFSTTNYDIKINGKKKNLYIMVSNVIKLAVIYVATAIVISALCITIREMTGL